MNRRQFLSIGIGAVAAVAVPAVAVPAVASAEKPKSKRVAIRIFESNELNLSTAVFWYDDGKAAFTALTKYLADQIAEGGDPTTSTRITDYRDVTKDAPKVGDERLAHVVTTESPETATDIHLLLVRQGNLVYVFQAYSAGNISTLLATTVNDTATKVFKRVAKPSTFYTDEALLNRLPRQNEVPSTFQVTEEQVGGDDITS